MDDNFRIDKTLYNDIKGAMSAQNHQQALRLLFKAEMKTLHDRKSNCMDNCWIEIPESTPVHYMNAKLGKLLAETYNCNAAVQSIKCFWQSTLKMVISKLGEFPYECEGEFYITQFPGNKVITIRTITSKKIDCQIPTLKYFEQHGLCQDNERYDSYRVFTSK